MRAVLLAAYGSPSGIDDVERYYTCILGGRKPPQALLAELRERYAAIGGVSPLTEITGRQAEGLRRQLSGMGVEAVVRVGMKYSPPFIADSIAEFRKSGFQRVDVIPLTPFNSSVSIESYLAIARNAAGRDGEIVVTGPADWHLNRHFIDCWTDLLKRELRGKEVVIFTAHSIPQKYIDAGERYRDEIVEVAGVLAGQLGLGSHYVAFQSAGRTADKWIGPALTETLSGLREAGVKDVLLAPIGFVSEHLEVLYDIDIEAKKLAGEMGMQLRRTGLPDDNPEFIKALADACTGS